MFSDQCRLATDGYRTATGLPDASAIRFGPKVVGNFDCAKNEVADRLEYFGVFRTHINDPAEDVTFVVKDYVSQRDKLCVTSNNHFTVIGLQNTSTVGG